MNPGDRDDPFDDIFREIERMMNEMVGTPGPQAGGARTDLQLSSSTHVDVYEDEGTVRVVADLPGVSRSDISVQCDGEYVTIGAESDTRSYDERGALPAHVDPESGNGTYNNGVLEVTFDRTDTSTNIDVQ